MSYTYPFAGADENLKRSVWEKGVVDPDYDPNNYRKDIRGIYIRYMNHGNTNSDYGWEIDHIKPTSIGGSDSLSNLQPLHWLCNRLKGDTYPWVC